MDGVRATRMGWAPRAWLARFRLEPDGGATHITERSLYALQPLIRDHLTSPFPFHIKVLLALHIEKLDPATPGGAPSPTPLISACTRSLRP